MNTKTHITSDTKKEFTAKSAAAEFNIPIDTLYSRIAAGDMRASVLFSTKRVGKGVAKYLIDGRHWTTTELAQHLNMSHSSVRRRLIKGARTLVDLRTQKVSNSIHPNWETAMVNDEMMKLFLRTI